LIWGDLDELLGMLGRTSGADIFRLQTMCITCMASAGGRLAPPTFANFRQILGRKKKHN